MAMLREQMPVKEWLGYQIKWFREPEELPENTKNLPLYYETKDGEHWDLLAWLFYGNEEKWYYLADVNGISDPFEPIQGGIKIVVPPLKHGGG